jgi:hypothetical protein
VDYSKYKHETLKTDSSSTSHLVESAENSSIQAPPLPVPNRPSHMTSTHSSYRQAPPISVSLSYRQASALPGFRPSVLTRPYSPEQDDGDEVSTSINVIPLIVNRSRTTTPLGPHKSLSDVHLTLLDLFCMIILVALWSVSNIDTSPVKASTKTSFLK